LIVVKEKKANCGKSQVGNSRLLSLLDKLAFLTGLVVLQMFADLHHAHQFVALHQGGSMDAGYQSVPGGTSFDWMNQSTSIYFGNSFL
jgi:hypothetical protein